MRRVVLAIALCQALLFVGCSNLTSDLQGDTSDLSLILFSVESDDSDSTSRGSIVWEFTDGDQIGLYGYYIAEGDERTLDANFMNNQMAECSGDVWSYSPLKYWSQSSADTFEFYAYAPYQSQSNGITTSCSSGELVIYYTTPINCADQEDLMIAEPIAPFEGDSVLFKMHHALATVSFSVVCDDSFASAEVTSLALSGVMDRGELRWSRDSVEMEWSNLSISDESLSYSALINSGVVVGVESQLLTSDDGLMVIPQSIPSEGFVVSLTLGSGDDQEQITFTILPELTPRWQAGARYSYTLELSGGGESSDSDSDAYDPDGNVIYLDTTNSALSDAMDILEAGYTTIYFDGRYRNYHFFSGRESLFEQIAEQIERGDYPEGYTFSVDLSALTNTNSIFDDLKRDLFSDNIYLSSVVLPSSLNKIDEYAFEGCINLRSVIVASADDPAEIDSIEDYAFYNCTKLELVMVYTSKGKVDTKNNTFTNSGLDGIEQEWDGNNCYSWSL